MSSVKAAHAVGWCISNREDQTLPSNFYTQIQQHVSANIQPKRFMSDDAGQYYTAWTLSFGGHPGKLLCTWHVDRAWRNAISNINYYIMCSSHTLLVRRHCNISQNRHALQTIIDDQAKIGLQQFALTLQ